MKARVVTTVGIRHHRIETMPHLMRLAANGDGTMLSRTLPNKAPRGLLFALAISGVLWMGIAAVTF